MKNWIVFILGLSLGMGVGIAADLKKSMADVEAIKASAIAVKPEARKAFQDCIDCPTMVLIVADGDLANFALAQTEVTQKQWQDVMGSNPSRFKNCGPDCPVENVSWNDVQEYIKNLNTKTGKTYRLPTEREWEYACLATEATDYCGGNNIDVVAWNLGNSHGTTHRVGAKQPNKFSLYDMSGNVSEWTDSCYMENCSMRAVRGGSLDYGPQISKASSKYKYAISFRGENFGFRLARSAR